MVGTPSPLHTIMSCEWRRGVPVESLLEQRSALQSRGGSRAGRRSVGVILWVVAGRGGGMVRGSWWGVFTRHHSKDGDGLSVRTQEVTTGRMVRSGRGLLVLGFLHILLLRGAGRWHSGSVQHSEQASGSQSVVTDNVIRVKTWSFLLNKYQMFLSS